MKRLSFAAGLALLIHVLFFGMKIGEWQKPSYMMQPARKLTMSLSYREPQKVLPEQSPKELPQDQAKRAVVKPKKASLPEPIPEPKLQPKKIATQTQKKPFAKADPDKQFKVEQIKNKFSERAGGQTKNENLDDRSAIVHLATPLYHLNPPPKYPQIAKKRGYQGTVLLNVLVEDDGKVGDLEIYQTSGYSILDRSAQKSVQKWIFSPGKKGAKEVAMWVRVPVRFQLQ